MVTDDHHGPIEETISQVTNVAVNVLKPVVLVSEKKFERRPISPKHSRRLFRSVCSGTALCFVSK